MSILSGNETIMRYLKAFIWLSYLLTSFLFLYKYAYYSTDDTIAYFNIARNYSRGHFIDALNACWSPLISWLLVPLMKAGINEFYAFKLINIFCGVACIIICEKLLVKLTGKKTFAIQIFQQLTLSVLLIAYQATNAMPDLLGLTFVLLYAYFMAGEKPDYKKAGIAGAIAYLAKAYNFFFFIASYALCLFYEIAVRKKRAGEFLKNYSYGLAVFLFLSGIWISLLYVKYDQFIISSAGAYNTIVVQPSGTTTQFNVNKIIAPPNEHATSNWYDPTYFNIKPRTPLKSVDDFINYLPILRANIWLLNYYMSCLSYFKIFWLLLIPALLYFLPVSNKKTLLLLFLFSFLYLFGYSLIFMDERYILSSYFLLIVLTFSLCSYFIEQYPRFTFFILLIPAISIMKNSVVHYQTLYGKEEALKKNVDHIYKLASLPYFKSSNWIADRNNRECYVLAYLSESKYYGFFGKRSFKEALSENVDVSTLDYYLSFDDKKLDNTIFIKDLDFYEQPVKLYRFIKKEK